jgi:hypothetical protein
MSQGVDEIYGRPLLTPIGPTPPPGPGPSLADGPPAPHPQELRTLTAYATFPWNFIPVANVAMCVRSVRECDAVSHSYTSGLVLVCPPYGPARSPSSLARRARAPSPSGGTPGFATRIRRLVITRTYADLEYRREHKFTLSGSAVNCHSLRNKVRQAFLNHNAAVSLG